MSYVGQTADKVMSMEMSDAAFPAGAGSRGKASVWGLKRCSKASGSPERAALESSWTPLAPDLAPSTTARRKSEGMHGLCPTALLAFAWL